MRPLLMNFAVDKVDSLCSGAQLRYNEELDANEILLTPSTSSKVSMETPAQTPMNVGKSNLSDSLTGTRLFEYLAAKTVTEVKPEKPDYMGNEGLVELLATSTFTKTHGEQPDRD